MKRFPLKSLPSQRLWKNITNVQHWDLSIRLGKRLLITFQNNAEHKIKRVSIQNTSQNLLHKCQVVQIWLTETPLCYFYNEELETLEHFLFYCEKVNTFWNELNTILKSQDLVSANFDIKNILFGHFCSDDDDSILANYIILESKYLIFCSKLSKSPFICKMQKKHTKSNVSLSIKITNSISTIKNGYLSFPWWNFSYHQASRTTISTNVAFCYLFLQVTLA